MILNALLYIAVFLNCFVIGRIVSTDCSNDDLLHICRLALVTVSFNTVIIVGFTLTPLI